jgi:hypothetical protein
LSAVIEQRLVMNYEMCTMWSMLTFVD